MLKQIRQVTDHLQKNICTIDSYPANYCVITTIAVKKSEFKLVRELTNILHELGYVQMNFYLSPCFNYIFQQFMDG